MYVVLTVLCALPILVAMQVVRIHVQDGAKLRAQGEKQARTFATLPAVRGSIYDRNGRTLAVNTARHDLAIDPTFGNFSEVQDAFYSQLAEVTGHSRSKYRARVNGRPGSKYVSLERGLSERQRAIVDSWDYPFVILESSSDRRYNYETTLAHVLGHVNSDGTGAAGLELQYDTFLRGEDGKRERRRDAHGIARAVVGGGDVSPRHGESLVLTIDLVQQAILEEALADGMRASGARWAAAVAVDPRTGEVLAMANLPTYDPNHPADYPADARRNRSVTDQFEPGSTFKLVSAVTAVETKAVKLSDEIDTGNGYARFGNRELYDTHGYGVISYADVISLSSNIGIAKVAERVEARKMYEYARNLGFGQRTWIDLPGEVAGVLKKPDEWSGTTLASMSIGYEVGVTALQIANAYAAFANGGKLLQPYVVAERLDINGDVTWRAHPDSVRNAFKRKTAVALLEAFESVVIDGTAKKAHVEGIRIAGKTGTANKVFEGAYVRGRSRASFVGFFPADDPQVVLAIVMDEPASSIYGGDVSAPVFKRVVEGWLPMLEGVHPVRRPDLSEETAVPLEAITMPRVDGAPVAVARGLLRTAGIEVSVPSRIPDTAIVQDVELLRHDRDVQVAAVHPVAVADGDARERTDEKLMPDLTGLGARQAVYWLRANNIDVKVEGHGRVVSQTPRPGQKLTGEARLNCR